MTMRFVHETLAQRVHFATGAAADAVADEVDRLGGRRVMVIAAPAEAALARAVTTGLPVTLVHDEVAMHVPLSVAERARAAASDHSVDVVISVGGGSTTGLAKAVALTSGLPVIAVPTTYAGSEATDVWGLTDDGHKLTGSDARVLPRAVVYDACLTLTLPVDLSVASGLNGLAHCVDALWAPRADPINAALATEGIKTLAQGLALVIDDPTGLDGRERSLCGAHLAAVAFASAGSGLHHKICHVLGGRYNLPHAATHAIVLPHVVALNAPAAPQAAERIAEALGSATALGGLQALRARLHAPRALRDHGFLEQQIDDAIEAILPVVPDSNPAEVTALDLQRLLHNAWEGADPE
ncbi:maleylacetate reductase [Mycolicibacterium sp. 120266]|uniref:maleylacetate reductase n=1 Tax=Mycolicibacterium sp. 120266 TaxID=3090601 RepID=UPI00299EE4C5|nr:maleylacetate reductase [Mycolicibacterium sp. 120266]MDX1873265.1 maleylacetate reductase [Mycolicibacterium sp. 120266]